MMNRILSRKLAACLAINMFLLMIAPPTWAQGANTQVLARHRAIITAVTGNVEVKTAGTTAWVKAAANREVKTGDRIRTAAGAKAKIKVGDVGSFDVGASSEVTVGNLQQVKTSARAFFMFQREITRDDVAVDLKSGDMRSGFQRHEGRVGNYNVYTPVAVAGVRGTQFELDLDGGKAWYEKMEEGKGQGEEESLTAAVLEGEVGLVGPNWERSIVGGQQLFARMGQIPGDPTNADPNRLRGIGNAFQAAADARPPVFQGATGATRPTPTSMRLTWAPATDDTTVQEKIVYDVFLATGSASQDFNIPSATSEPGATEFTLTGLNEGANYYVVVRARDEAGNRDANTKEVSTVVGDATAPTFAGASKVERSGSEATVSWSAASDNLTSPDNIGYDIYWSTFSEGQNFSVPNASTDSGALSFKAEGLSAGTTYFFVVRARDGAGNREANKVEVSTAGVITQADSFDTNAELARLTESLFDAYAGKRQSDFMNIVSTNFAGVNNLGNSLTTSTLEESIKSDFELLSSAEFDHSITSITPYGESQYGVNVTWDGTFRFLTVDTEVKRTGLASTFVFEGDRPFVLSSWTGAAPFGLSVPYTDTVQVSTDDPTSDPPETIYNNPVEAIEAVSPTIESVYPSNPTFAIPGNHHDFAPLSFTITGTNFQAGSKVEILDDGLWEDAANFDIDHVGTLEFRSSTELAIAYSVFKEQVFPNDVSPENLQLRVVNPDGSISAAFDNYVSLTPGPISIAQSATAPFPTVSQASGSYTFEIEGYNLVTPLTVSIVECGSGNADPDFTVTSHTVTQPVSYAGNPAVLTVHATVSGDGTNVAGNSSYKLIVTNAEYDAAELFIDVTATANPTWNGAYDPYPTSGSTYVVPVGQTLTINGGPIGSSNGTTEIEIAGELVVNGPVTINMPIHFTGGGFGNLTSATVNGGAVAAIHHQSSGTVLVSGGTYSSTGPAISVDGGGTLRLSGATVSGATGVFLSGGSFLELNGGVSINNGSTGIDIVNGTLTTSGTNNFIDGSSIGIQMASGDATLSTGTTIRNGGTKGVYMTGGQVTLAGGAIENKGGYGAYISGGTFVMNSGSITGNGGHGIYTDAGTFTFNGGTISNHNIGVEVNGGAFGATGGNITGPGTYGIQITSSTSNHAINNINVTGHSTWELWSSNPDPVFGGRGDIDLNNVSLDGSGSSTLPDGPQHKNLGKPGDSIVSPR